MEHETRFYQQPLFMWILILFVPPIGLLLLWYFAHYTFVIRVLVSMYFFTLFRFNTWISLVILTIIVYGFLHMHNLTLDRVEESDSVDDDDDYTMIPKEQIDQMDSEQFNHLIRTLLIKMGYDLTQNNDPQLKGIDLFAKKESKIYGIKLRPQHDIIKQDVLELCDGMDYYGCNRGVVITNQRYTPCAKEASEQVKIFLWNETVLYEQIDKFKVSLEEWQSENIQ